MPILALLLLAADSAVPAMQPAPGVPSLLQSGIPEIPPELKERVGQYLNSRAASLLDVSDDGAELLIATRFASTNQLHVVETPLGMRTQITFGNEPISQARFAPGDPQTVWYLRDAGGGEFYQVFRLDRRTGLTEMVTDGKSRHGALTLSRDGTRIAFSGTARNGKDTDVYVVDATKSKAATRITEAEGTWAPVEFSPDGKQILIVHERSIEDADLHVFDVQSGQLRQITPKEGKASVAAASFTADGKGIYLVTDRWSDFDQLYRIGADGKRQPLSAQMKWGVEELAVAGDGSHIAMAVNEDGVSKLYLLNAHTGAAHAVALPQTAVIGSMRFPRKRTGVLALTFQTATQPSDAYEVEVRTGRLTRWTRSEVGGLDPTAFVDAKLVRYPAAGGGTMPAFLYAPRGASGKLPVVIVWHGGPEGQSRPTFFPLVQLLASELHFAVLLPNVRGSAGYGKAYLAADNGVKREEALKDIGATLDFIAGRPELDAGRIGVYGGSYGGYMTLATAAFYAKRVRVAVDVVGISSLPSFLTTTQPYRRDLRRAEYGDERDPAVRAVQERISPLGSVGQIEAELFVQQGKNDPRVPQSEAEQIVQAVRARGKDVWYLLGLNEGHGFQKKENREYATAATAFFLQQKLLATPRTN
jgi:dipeptidyl aminopeptidase/acylaminoacyl peptidase